jgi:tetratricopeptide (TPR) repeat protein
MSNQDSNEEITALAIRSAQELSTRSSLVSRGLKEIVDGFQIESADFLLDKATALVHQERFYEACAVCTAALEMYPNDQCFLVTKAVCLAKQGQYEQGLPFLLRALEIDEQNQHSWVLAARFYNHLIDPEEELKCWNRVVAIDPDYKGAWRGMGECLLKFERYRDAIQAFDSELKLHPSDDYCHSQRDRAVAELLGDQCDWAAPLNLSLMGWYSEAFDGRQLAPYTETRYLNLISKIRNVSDHECLIGKQMSMYRRSKVTGEMTRFAEALILEDAMFTLPLRIAPHSEVDPISVEVTWACSLDKTDPDCVDELFDLTWETVARDDELGTIIRFVG